ncbi:uncharacterized protein, partial [Clytia hemisphaerica]|uniref:uncharacterized protein n=1 Tax=Clytia hemisphaerica TaxID=252671 RepID=UPI0034D5A3C0
MADKIITAPKITEKGFIAMKICPECTKRIGVASKSCAHCGHIMQKKKSEVKERNGTINASRRKGDIKKIMDDLHKNDDYDAVTFFYHKTKRKSCRKRRRKRKKRISDIDIDIDTGRDSDNDSDRDDDN